MTKRLTNFQLLTLLAFRDSEPQQRYSYAVLRKINQTTDLQLSRETFRTALSKLIDLGLISVDHESSQVSKAPQRKYYYFPDTDLVNTTIDLEMEHHQQNINQAAQHLAQLVKTARFYKLFQA